MAKILITGGSGFIGKHLIGAALEAGHTVRTSVRSDRRRAQIEALFGPDAVEFVSLDLNDDAGWTDAMGGIDVLLHTASPFPFDEPKHRDELIKPAVEGTQRAVRAARDASVDQVIVTSSCAAIYKDPNKPDDAVSTEANWTDPDAPFVNAYEASKTLAERAAWKIADDGALDLTVINPAGVFGPPMDRHFGTSLDIVAQVLEGKIPAVPDVQLPVVDVRDVAAMHIAAIGNDDVAGQRFAASAGTLTLLDVARTLSAAYPERKIPVRKAPSWLIRLGGVFNNTMRTAAANLGRNLSVDGSHAATTFGIDYVSAQQSILDAAEWIDRESKTATASTDAKK